MIIQAIMYASIPGREPPLPVPAARKGSSKPRASPREVGRVREQEKSRKNHPIYSRTNSLSPATTPLPTGTFTRPSTQTPKTITMTPNTLERSEPTGPSVLWNHLSHTYPFHVPFQSLPEGFHLPAEMLRVLFQRALHRPGFPGHTDLLPRGLKSSAHEQVIKAPGQKNKPCSPPRSSPSC